MQSWIELNSRALLNNYKVFTDITGQGKVAAVLKSNGYGHGLAEIYGILKKENLGWICVAYLEEAEALRNLGYSQRILLVTPLENHMLAPARRLDCDVLLFDQDSLSFWISQSDRPRAHLKIDTGLTRQGFRFSDLAALPDQLAPYRNELVGICTHFANVEDVLEQEFALLQLKRISDALNLFQSKGFNLLCHSASSASCLILKESRFDLSRIGISLYGFWPSQSTRLSYLQLNSKIADLIPVLSFKTKIALVKEVQNGDYVGYGCSFRANATMRLGILPVGYNDGYIRQIGSGPAYVLIHGSRCPLVGRISMNLMAVDITHTHANKGDTVTLVGTEGDETLTASTVAEWGGTIHYELVTKLHPSIRRVVV